MAKTTQAIRIVEQMERTADQRAQLEDQLRQQVQHGSPSIPEIARRASISHPSVYNWIYGKRKLSLPTLKKIAEAID